MKLAELVRELNEQLASIGDVDIEVRNRAGDFDEIGLVEQIVSDETRHVVRLILDV